MATELLGPERTKVPPFPPSLQTTGAAYPTAVNVSGGVSPRIRLIAVSGAVLPARKVVRFVVSVMLLTGIVFLSGAPD